MAMEYSMTKLDVFFSIEYIPCLKEWPYDITIYCQQMTYPLPSYAVTSFRKYEKFEKRSLHFCRKNDKYVSECLFYKRILKL